jgi:hypothetical protein
VHEHGGARHGIGRLEQVAEQRQAVLHDLGRGLEVAEHERVALLGELRRGGDVDDERHPALLGDLRDRGGLAGVEGADQYVRTLLNQPLSARARHIHVRLVVSAHDLDVHAKHFLDDARREIGALLTRPTDEALHARSR